MRSKKLLSAVLLAVAVVVAAVVFDQVGRDARGPAAAESPAQSVLEVEVEAARAVTEELAPAEAPEPAAEERVEVEETAPVEEEDVALSDDLAEIRGRFVLEDGSPAIGVALTVHGWGANQERKLKFGVPEDWTDPTGESDDDGRFALRFEPPRAFQFTLDAKTPGYGEASWRWSEITPGRVVDVGEVTLRRGGTIAGRIVDGDGNAITGPGWMVYADAGDRISGGRDQTRSFAIVDPDTGTFRVEDMPPGRVELRARHDMADLKRGTTVTAVAGETVEAEIVYAGKSFSSRIMVTTFSRPFYVMNDPPESSIRLLGAASGPIEATKLQGSSQSYTFEDLSPGTYTVEVDDPAYLPWRQEGVEPGSRVRPNLVGSAALRLSVLDESGDPVDVYSLRVRFRNVNFSPNEFAVHDGKTALVGGLYAGMFPGDYALTVASEAGSAQVEVDGLVPGETRDVRVQLGSSTVVRGSVTRAGRPVQHVDVQLIRPAEVDDSHETWIISASASVSGGRERFRREVDSTATDAAGRFHFDLAGEGTFLLHAEQDIGMDVWSSPFTIGSGEEHEVKLELASVGRIVGRVLTPEGTSPAGFRLWARSEGMDSRTAFTASRKQQVTLSADGSFELGPLPAGQAVLLLSRPAGFEGRTRTVSGYHWLQGMLEVGTVVVPPGGVVEHDVSFVDTFPGTRRVAVTAWGQPRASLEVTVSSKEHGTMRANTDAEGLTPSYPLFHGEWHVHVTDYEQGWLHRHPEAVEVRRDEDVLHIDVRPVEGTITLIDQELAEAIADTTITIRSLTEPVRTGGSRPVVRVRRKTDGEGRLTLVLTSGEYRLETGERQAVLTWTDQGPAVAEIDL